MPKLRLLLGFKHSTIILCHYGDQCIQTIRSVVLPTLFCSQLSLHMNDQLVETYVAASVPTAEYPHKTITQASNTQNEAIDEGSFTFRVEDLAYTRSGDKGNTANIGK